MKLKLTFSLLLALVLAGCASAPQEVARSQEPMAPTARAEERLGTKWGDEIASSVRSVNLRRQSETPLDENIIRYANRQYRGQSLNSISLAAGSIELRVESDSRALPMVRDGRHYYLQGREGQPYQLVYRNNSRQTYEIVAAVDGLDVISGRTASRRHSGYVLYPQQSLVIQGFRKSQQAVASFIFSKPADAYAARTPAGQESNTGVIATVVYELYDPASSRQPSRPTPAGNDEPNPFPADGRYAPPPR